MARIENIPYGFCNCGCGELAEVAKRTRPELGHVAGEPTRFKRGHVSAETKRRSKEATEHHRGEMSPTWKGGRSTANGYVIVAISDDHPFAVMKGNKRYVYEHRLVMAEIVGRPLGDEEVVHHINGDKTDNRTQNLALFPDQASHMRFHARERRERRDAELNEQHARVCRCTHKHPYPHGREECERRLNARVAA